MNTRARDRAWRAANGVMLALFALSVIVQLNDPDPWTWIPVYAAAAAMCAAELARRARWWMPVVIALGSVVWAATIAPHVIGIVPFLDMFGAWEMKDIGIEESREMYGLLIVAAWMVVLAVANRPGSAQRP